MALVLHHSRAKGTDKLILLGIANHDGDGGAWPTVATLARYANLEHRAVQSSIRRLVASGELVVAVQAGGTSDCPEWQRPNRYEVLVACPATCDRTKNHKLADLPKAPAALWMDPLSPTTPGVAHDTPPMSSTTPPRVSPTTPKPSIQPDTPTVVSTVTGSGPSCSVCTLPEDQCQRRSRTSGHTYTPRSA